MAYIKENKAALAALYNRIGNHLAAELPNGWTYESLEKMTPAIKAMWMGENLE